MGRQTWLTHFILALPFFFTAMLVSTPLHADTARRDYSGYQMAVPSLPGSVQHGGSGVGFQKSAADTFYIYGGPEGASSFADPAWNGQFKVEGRFEDEFGQPDAQGWSGLDMTEAAPFWHASQINANTLGEAGNWAVISHHEGPDYFGYGNNWDDRLVFELDVAALGLDPTVDATDIRLTMGYTREVETTYDFLRVEYVNTSGRHEIAGFTGGHGDSILIAFDFDSDDFGGIHYEPSDYVDGKAILRLRVTSDGAWSDEDGLYNTEGDGGASADNMVVSVNGNVVSVADWEPLPPKRAQLQDLPEGVIEGHNNGAAVGTAGWTPTSSDFSGDFFKIFTDFQDLDPCRTNSSPQAGFIDDGTPPNNGGSSTGGSTSPTWNYGIPGAWVVNYTGGLSEFNDSGLENEIWSPEIEWNLPGTADDIANGGAAVRFSRYLHLPLTNGIFMIWHVRSFRSDVGWDDWGDFSFIYYRNTPAYDNLDQNVSGLLLQDPERVQIALGVIDLATLFGFPGNDGTPSPLFDNVMFKKYRIGGPSITTRDIDIAGDAFPTDGSIGSSVRWDANLDIGPAPGGTLVPADSVVLAIQPIIPGSVLQDPPGGAGGVMKVAHLMHPDFGGPGSGARAAGFTDSRITNLSLQGTDSRGWSIFTYEVVGQPVRVNGATVEDRYFFDLPDGDPHPNAPHQVAEDPLFFPGDVIHYSFEATDDQGGLTKMPADQAGFLDFEPATPYSRVFTVRALPTVAGTGQLEQPSLLFWNDFGHRGGEDEYSLAFAQAGFLEGRDYDTYTTKGPSSLAGNGLGARAIADQLAGYDTIVYVSGDLSNGLISDGTDADGNGKSNDVQAMTDWHNQEAERNHVYFGDSFARGMAGQGATTQGYINGVVGVDAIAADVRPVIDGQTAAIVTSTGAMPGTFVTDFVAFGGCLSINQFDEIVPFGGEPVVIHEFLHPTGLPYDPSVAAGLWWARVQGGYAKTTAVFPFDLHYVRDVAGAGKAAGGISARAALLKEVLQGFGVQGGTATANPPISLPFAVGQNFPNPFNPRTKISVYAPRRGNLSLKVYNVRGELIRVLHEGVVNEGDHAFIWDGRDGTGSAVASGIYLYKTEGFGRRQVHKMALVR